MGPQQWGLGGGGGAEVIRSSLKCIIITPLHKRCSAAAGCLACIIEETVYRGFPSQLFFFLLLAFNSSLKNRLKAAGVTVREGKKPPLLQVCERRQWCCLRRRMSLRVVRYGRLPRSPLVWRLSLFLFVRAECWSCSIFPCLHWLGLQDGDVSPFSSPALAQEDCDSSHHLRGCHLQQGHRGRVRTIFFYLDDFVPNTSCALGLPCKVILASFYCWNGIEVVDVMHTKLLHGRSTLLCFNLSVFRLTL